MLLLCVVSGVFLFFNFDDRVVLVLVVEESGRSLWWWEDVSWENLILFELWGLFVRFGGMYCEVDLFFDLVVGVVFWWCGVGFEKKECGLGWEEWEVLRLWFGSGWGGGGWKGVFVLFVLWWV